MKRTLDEWLSYQQTVHPAGIALGLDRLRPVARALGVERPARFVITVAGTNGKGSTVAFAEAIARSAGLRVAAYTSPHLQRYTERLRIDGREVSAERLNDAFEKIEAARGEVPLTYFEFGTLAALLIMQSSSLDIALLEVGMGGRLDAVNLIDADVSVLTGVGLDHMEHLGPDREAIGIEKAGIFRAGRPAVVGEDLPPISVLEEIDRIGAVGMRAGLAFSFRRLTGGSWRYQDSLGEVELPPPALEAPCQLRNAACAIAALRALPGLPPITDAALAEGLGDVRLRGRLQRLPGPVEILLDVAHNPDSTRELAEWLAGHRPRGTTQAVFSALPDKDIPHMVAAMLPVIDAWHFAGLQNAGGRGGTVDEVWRQVSGLMSRSISARHATVADALTSALSSAQSGDRVLVFGSFYTVGAALTALGSDS